jgi:hypothetical protein
MSKLFLATALLLAGTSPSLSQAGFNPGTVVSNVYESLASEGCGTGFGFSPSGCNYFGFAPGDRCHHQHAKLNPPIAPNCYIPSDRGDLARPWR